MGFASLTADQLNFVRTRVAQVDKQLKERFDKACASWKATRSHPLIAPSSAPTARIQRSWGFVL